MELIPYQRKDALTWKHYLAGNIFQLWGTSVIAKYAVEDMKEKVGDGISAVNFTLEKIGAEFNYGMCILAEKIDAQQKGFEKILQGLDEIHDTLKSPTITRARELYRLGMERLSRNLLDKALAVFLEAEKLNETDIFIQLQIGKLYLYGKDEDDDVIDIEKAGEHLKDACRYVREEIVYLSSHKSQDAYLLQEIQKKGAECFFHYATFNLVKGNELFIVGNSEQAQSHYREAAALCEKAIGLNKNFYEVFYLAAKCYALLGDDKSTIYVKYCFEKDKGYIEKISKDSDFENLRTEIQSKIITSISGNLEVRKKELSVIREEIAAFYQQKEHYKQFVDSLGSSVKIPLLDRFPEYTSLIKQIDDLLKNSSASVGDCEDAAKRFRGMLDSWKERFEDIKTQAKEKFTENIKQDENNDIEKMVKEELNNMRENSRVNRKIWTSALFFMAILSPIGGCLIGLNMDPSIGGGAGGGGVISALGGIGLVVFLIWWAIEKDKWGSCRYTSHEEDQAIRKRISASVKGTTTEVTCLRCGQASTKRDYFEKAICFNCGNIFSSDTEKQDFSR